MESIRIPPDQEEEEEMGCCCGGQDSGLENEMKMLFIWSTHSFHSGSGHRAALMGFDFGLTCFIVVQRRAADRNGLGMLIYSPPPP